MIGFKATFGLVAIALTFSACFGAGDTSDSAVRMSGDAEGAPSGCTTDDIATRLKGAFDAISRGDPHAVDDFFGGGRQAPFQWYSMTGRDHFVAYTWDDLTTYFTQRHQHGERLRLLEVRFNGWEQERGLVHFGPIVVERTADDLDLEREGRGPIVEGKGAYHCETKAFVVLSLGMRGA